MPKIRSNPMPAAATYSDELNGLMFGERLRESHFREPAREDIEVGSDRGVPIREEMPEYELNPRMLPEILPRSGFVQRWCRINDPNYAGDNIFGIRMRQGWRPRDPATLPQRLRLFASNKAAMHGENHFQCGQMVLCEMPIEVMEKHRASRAALLAKHNSAAEEAKITSGLRKTARENGAQVHHSEIKVTRETTRVPETLAD